MRRVRFASRHPRMALRHLRGLSPLSIDLPELDAHIGPGTVILEAGAYDGGDTEQMALRWPGATIHAIEPIPESYEQLVRRVARLANVQCHQIALGSGDGTATMHVSTTQDRGADSSSLLEPTEHLEHFPHVHFPHTIDVSARTLDSWATEHQVDKVDVAWLDLQGMEVAVLRASPRIRAHLRAIVMEVSRVPLYRGAPVLDDVLPWMADDGWHRVISRVGQTYGNALFVR